MPPIDSNDLIMNFSAKSSMYLLIILSTLLTSNGDATHPLKPASLAFCSTFASMKAE